MFTKSASNQSKKSPLRNQKNPIETLKDSGSSSAKTGGGIFDQFFGNLDSDFQSSSERIGFPGAEQKSQAPSRREFSLFNYQEYYERELVKKQIKELTEQIKKEIEYLKKADQALIADVKDIEKLSLESMPDKPGIYHIRFMEIILSILRALRAKIGESRTWLQAMMTKKKKRGSLFMSLSKKKGTQYSLSQELQTARSVQ